MNNTFVGSAFALNVIFFNPLNCIYNRVDFEMLIRILHSFPEKKHWYHYGLLLQWESKKLGFRFKIWKKRRRGRIEREEREKIREGEKW